MIIAKPLARRWSYRVCYYLLLLTTGRHLSQNTIGIAQREHYIEKLTRPLRRYSKPWLPQHV